MFLRPLSFPSIVCRLSRQLAGFFGPFIKGGLGYSPLNDSKSNKMQIFFIAKNKSWRETILMWDFKDLELWGGISWTQKSTNYNNILKFIHY